LRLTSKNSFVEKFVIRVVSTTSINFIKLASFLLQSGYLLDILRADLHVTDEAYLSKKFKVLNIFY